MLPLIKLVLTILDLYKIIIIAGAVLSWLVAFGVVNIRNDFVRSIWNLFVALTAPFLQADPQLLAEHRRHRHLAGHSVLAIMFILRIIQVDIAPCFLDAP